MKPLGTQLTLLDLERNDKPLSLADKGLSPEKMNLAGEHRIVEVEDCPDWLLSASIRSGCRTVEALVKLFIERAEAWKCPMRSAANETLFAWRFYRDFEECERLAGVMLAMVTVHPALNRAARRRRKVGAR